MKKTVYTIRHGKIRKQLRIAVVADLHGNPPEKVLAVLREDPPDLIAVPGDLCERLDRTDSPKIACMYRFLEEATKISRVFYSYGNHELGAYSYGKKNVSDQNLRACGRECVNPRVLERISSLGVTLLDDRFADIGGIRIGGLTTGMIQKGSIPDMKWLSGFCEGDRFRILLCHHPEYYVPFLKHLPIDLILSGHAHGGHWRLFGQGIYAPGQGLFPRYTSGVIDGRLVISRGTGDHTYIPRLFNPHEVVYVHIVPEKP